TGAGAAVLQHGAVEPNHSATAPCDRSQHRRRLQRATRTAASLTRPVRRDLPGRAVSVTYHHPLLLSLRPRFAQLILAGGKTVELRRRSVNAPPGTLVILYASSPTMAIVGTARLRDVQVLDIESAWNRHRRRLGLSRTEFDSYLDGSANAY